MDDPFDIDWNAINRHHDDLRGEFHKLLAEPSQRVPEVGDRAIVASGLLGMGHPWIRHEADVIEVGETSVKVRFIGYREYGSSGACEKWVHPALITDVLPQNKEPRNGQSN